MRRCLLAIPLALFLGMWTQPASADSVPIGEISFDVTTPAAGPGLPGINSFDLTNITGGLTLPTDPGVVDTITITGQLSIVVAGSLVPLTQSFTGVGPSFFGAQSLLDLSSDVQVLSATLAGTLDNTLVTLNGGTAPVTLSSSFTVTDPFNGGFALTACTGSNNCSVGSISTSTVTAPEPGTLLLLGSGLSTLLQWRRRRFTG